MTVNTNTTGKKDEKGEIFDEIVEIQKEIERCRKKFLKK